jgi:hypothetical protein
MRPPLRLSPLAHGLGSPDPRPPLGTLDPLLDRAAAPSLGRPREADGVAAVAQPLAPHRPMI